MDHKRFIPTDSLSLPYYFPGPHAACPGDHPHLYSFFKHENEFYRVREGDLSGGPSKRLAPDADLKIGPLSPRFRMSVWDPLLEHLVFLFFCFLIQEYCRMSHLAGNRHQIYLENDGRLEHAQQMAGHESPRTTKL